ncbi:hypothetical protein GCM10027047_35160 [Rhodococcus aerolatus]
MARGLLVGGEVVDLHLDAAEAGQVDVGDVDDPHASAVLRVGWSCVTVVSSVSAVRRRTTRTVPAGVPPGAESGLSHAGGV